MRKTNGLRQTVVKRNICVCCCGIAAAAADFYAKFQLFPIAQNAQRAHKRRCNYATFAAGVTFHGKTAKFCK